MNTIEYKIHKKIKNILLIKHKKFIDQRGYFAEIYRKNTFSKLIPNFSLKQINFSRSSKFVARGMHLQLNPNLSKIMRVVRGKAIFLALDVRQKSVSRLHKIELSENDNTHVFAPHYYARGFISLSNNTCIEYLCNAYYEPKKEHVISMISNNFDLGIDIKKLKFSNRDKKGLKIRDFKKLSKIK